MPPGRGASYVPPVRTSSRPNLPAAATIGRRSFIGGAAAAAFVAAACGNDDDSGGGGRAGRDRTSGTTRSTIPPVGGLRWKGVNLDTEREVWNPDFVRHEIEVIARELHCNGIFLLGSDLDRLTESAALAADNGLHVWFEPRHFDADAAGTIAFVSEVARAAEQLRTEHDQVSLSLGVELTIFMHGLLPGDDWTQRAVALGTADPAVWTAGLDAFLTDARTAVRPIFGGPITYSSGVWEDVDWSGFDVVGIDLYRDEDNAATFVDDVRALHRHGKPVVITEFGCCTFRGAEDLGGMGFDVVDWTANPPVIPADLVRDEQVQADYIDELLTIFETEDVDGAFVYDFIEPGNPYSPDPRQDFDMVGFGVVKCSPAESEQAYERTGHFEPKAAFHTIARHFG